MIGRAAQALALLVPLLTLQSGPAQAESVPGQGFEVLRYHLALTPDIANKAVAGSEIVTLRPTIDGIRKLAFSANALRIDSATLDGVRITPSSEGGTLSFALPRALKAGRTVRLALTYHGSPARGFIGSGEALHTSYFACDWMICLQNRFEDKADFTLDLRVESGMDTLSVGRLISKRLASNGSEIHRWSAPRPYSPYLYGFAIGRFTRVTDGRLTYLSDVADDAELKRRFAETSQMVDFLAARAGLALPAPYTQLLVRGDEAQEAATYSIIGRDALPAAPNVPTDDWAVAHELAHQWWGNLVTAETITEFWLNEGITTFMTAAWKEHRYGRHAYDDELDLARARREKARAAGYDKPLAWNGTYPNLGLRRAVQYSKGALFMDHLRRTLGDHAFWSGLQRYTRAHAGGVVTSADLQRAMESASGRDLDPLFDEWVFGDRGP